MTNELYGLIVPIVTPLTSEQEVDVQALRRICEFQVEAGVNVIFALGTTGEFYGLSRTQRRQVVEVVVEAVAGRVPVISGICGDSTTASLAALADCSQPGVSGFVTSTPYFFAYSQAELLDYFRVLSDAAGEPLILYNYPARYRHLIDLDTISTLLAEKRVCAIKDTQGDLDYMRGLLELKSSFPDFLVFEGALPNLALSAPLGTDGSVLATGNLFPGECARLWSLAEQRDWSALGDGVSRMWAFFQEIETTAVFIAAIKGCMSLRDICGPTTAHPTSPVGPEQMSRLQETMERYDRYLIDAG